MKLTIRPGWRRLTLIAAGIAAGLGLVGLLIGWSGLINVAASSGHFVVTDVVLHWVMRQSVQRRSAGIEVPDLSDPALLHRAAGHYWTGCAPCHGGPGEERNPVVLRITPPPPDLEPKIAEWKANHLFWIVKHGVKFTAMPAWVASQRDDEIWAMVAFLLALPDMAPGTYRALALGERQPAAIDGHADLQGLTKPFDAALADCVRCHGRDGGGRGEGAFPLIGGQNEGYLFEALQAFAEGRRHSGIMQPASARAGEETRRALAAHYAAQPVAVGSLAPPDDTALVARGEEIARKGKPLQGMPACLSCHDAAARARNLSYPRLHGQDAGYLASQLRLMQRGVRGGGPYHHLMTTIAKRLEDDQIAAVAAYFAGARE